MHLLVPLAALLGIETDVLIDRLKKSVIAYAAIAIFVLIAVGFLLVAANTGLTTVVGPIWAPLIIAGCSLLLALGIYGVSAITANIKKSRDVQRRRSTETSAFITTAALTALPMILKSPMARNLGLPVAALVAFALFARNGSNPPRDE